MVTKKARAAGAVSPSASRPTTSSATCWPSKENAPERPISTASSRSGPTSGQACQITGMVEKPKPGKEPSNLVASVGRFVLQPEIFQILELVDKAAGGEVQADQRDDPPARPHAEDFTACASTRAPTTAARGFGFLTANLAFTLARHDIAPGLAEVAQAGVRAHAEVARVFPTNRRASPRPFRC